MNFQVILKYLGFLPWAVAITGISIFYKNFALVKVGPLYLLDVLFLLGMLFLVAGGFQKQQCVIAVSQSKWLGLFFVYGLVAFLISISRHAGDLNLKRVFQHGLVYVYPFIWSMAGFLVFSKYKDWSLRLGFLIVAVTFSFNVLGLPSPAMGVTGSLPVVLGVGLITKNWKTRDSRASKFNIWEAALLILAAFFPFWKMWLDQMQRTSLAILFFLMITAPVFFRRALLIPILLVGFFIGILVVTQISGGGDLKGNFYSSMQHGEDTPRKDNTETFQFRARSLFWQRALSQWKESPLLGIGFVREVPELTPTEMHFVSGETFVEPISGPHNSYLGILARMGVVGLLLLILAFFMWLKKTWPLWKETRDISHILVFYLFVNGALYACFNVGLESPHNSMMMWFFFGGSLFLASQRSGELRVASRVVP